MQLKLFLIQCSCIICKCVIILITKSSSSSSSSSSLCTRKHWIDARSSGNSISSSVQLLIPRYGSRSNDSNEFNELTSALSDEAFLISLLEHPNPNQFKALLQQFFTDSSSVKVNGESFEGQPQWKAHLFTVIATPSQQAADNLAAEEKAIVASRVETLGPDGLAAKEAEQEAAQEANDQEIPEELIANVPIPAVKGVSLHTVRSGIVYSGGEIQVTGKAQNTMEIDTVQESEEEEEERVVIKQLEEVKKAGCPYEVAVVHSHTAFATVACVFATHHLTVYEKR